MSENTDQNEANGDVGTELASIKRRLDAGSKRMRKIEDEMAINTEITTEIRDLLAAAKLGFKVLGYLGSGVKWVGSIAAAVGAIWTLAQAFLHIGPPPK